MANRRIRFHTVCPELCRCDFLQAHWRWGSRAGPHGRQMHKNPVLGAIELGSGNHIVELLTEVAVEVVPRRQVVAFQEVRLLQSQSRV